jgi:molybdopterin synthase sulfur carrier subunit
MHWRLFATLADAAAATEIEVESGADTVGDAFDALLEAYPGLESEVLDDEGELYGHVRLLHEGRDPFTEAEGFETTVDDGDELALFPPVSGG